MLKKSVDMQRLLAQIVAIVRPKNIKAIYFEDVNSKKLEKIIKFCTGIQNFQVIKYLSLKIKLFIGCNVIIE